MRRERKSWSYFMSSIVGQDTTTITKNSRMSIKIVENTRNYEMSAVQ